MGTKHEREMDMGKIVSFANQKGGVGKTTTCVNMTAYLASMGNKCLLVDIDAQGNATTGLGINKTELQLSAYNVLAGDTPLVDAVVKSKIDNLDILPASVDLAGAEVDLVYVKRREYVLFEALSQAKKVYDYIMIDCPPSLGLVTINALVASDSVIIPIQSEYYALEGLAQLMNTIKLVKKHLNENLQVEGVVLTMNDNRALMTKQISDEIKKYFGKCAFETKIPRNIRLAEAPSHGVPIMFHDANSKGAKAYFALTEEFLERQPKKVKEYKK